MAEPKRHMDVPKERVLDRPARYLLAPKIEVNQTKLKASLCA